MARVGACRRVCLKNTKERECFKVESLLKAAQMQSRGHCIVPIGLGDMEVSDDLGHFWGPQRFEVGWEDKKFGCVE